MTRCL